jgi:DNA-binding MarR family transcriptional regulator
MGRGLSHLQRQILRLVLKEKFVTCQNLLTLWGVQPGAVSNRDRYAAAHSSLSRALTRLWWRGLVTYWQNKLTHFRTGVTLTDEGKVLAQAISEEEAESEING